MDSTEYEMDDDGFNCAHGVCSCDQCTDNWSLKERALLARIKQLEKVESEYAQFAKAVDTQNLRQEEMYQELEEAHKSTLQQRDLATQGITEWMNGCISRDNIIKELEYKCAKATESLELVGKAGMNFETLHAKGQDEYEELEKTYDLALFEIKRLKATIKSRETALQECEAFAVKLYDMVQMGAGCCGDAIGRGSRIDQVRRFIAERRMGMPSHWAVWLEPAKVMEVNDILSNALTDDLPTVHARLNYLHSQVELALSKIAECVKQNKELADEDDE